MAIKIPQPSMVINSDTVTPFSMWAEWTIPDHQDPHVIPVYADDIIEHVASIADSAPDGYLRVVIFNSHGSGAWIHLGAGITSVRPAFARWQGRVANIWSLSRAGWSLRKATCSRIRNNHPTSTTEIYSALGSPS